MGKFFYGAYDGNPKIIESTTCSECLATEVMCVEFTAEHNAGELYTVEICRKCLLSWADKLCAYPDCVDDSPDERCSRWLTGDCPGPKGD